MTYWSRASRSAAASLVSARVARPQSARRISQCVATTTNSRASDARRGLAVTRLDAGASALPMPKASPGAIASGSDNARGANQTGAMDWAVTMMNSQLPASPRMAAGTHQAAPNASPAYTAVSTQTRRRLGR